MNCPASCRGFSVSAGQGIAITTLGVKLALVVRTRGRFSDFAAGGVDARGDYIAGLVSGGLGSHGGGGCVMVDGERGPGGAVVIVGV